MIFSVEIKDSDQIRDELSKVEIFLDKEALDDLIQQLKFLKYKGDNAHFMSHLWGGNELSVTTVRQENIAIHHLRISLV